MPDSNHQDGEDVVLRGPACDTCRARKVRCDRNHPCSHCVSARIPCKTTKKFVEKRQRISVSGKYDREIQSVSGRLASLEKLLEGFVNNQNQQPSARSPATSSVGPSLSTPRDTQLVWRDMDFQGDSSFSAHTMDITQAIEKGLKTSSNAQMIDSHRDVAAAVATLRSFMNEKPGSSDAAIPDSSAVQEVVDYPELSKLTLPSMQAVLSLLRYARTHPLKHLNDVPNLTVETLTARCQQIYFPAEEFTIATFITVHVILLNLFRELSPSELQDIKLPSTERDAIVAICLKNAEVAVRNLRLYMRPTFENIEACALGSTLAMDLSHASLAWTLITSAVRMAQDAGYHRLPPYHVAPDATPKRRLFWFLYSSERAMALNLGRSSSIRDHDIQTDRPKFPEELPGTVWDVMFNSWFDFAKIQGEIYDQLYCARAQKESVEVKADLARDLAVRLIKTREVFQFDPDDLGDEPGPFGVFLKEGFLSVDIVHYSTLCLIYRMIPPDPSPDGKPAHPLKFCNLAIDSARKALVTHNEAWDTLQNRSKDEWRMFVHWTLVWCPFIPYIILAGNVIADRNADDCRLLESCVDTLQAAAQLSPSVSKLYRACRIFYSVAKIYLNQPVDDTQPRAPASTAVPSNAFQPQQPQLLPENDIELPDFPLSQADWDGMLDEWDLGLGAENARDMSSFFEPYLSGGRQQ